MYTLRSTRATLPMRALLLGLCAGLACTLAWPPAGEVETAWSLDAAAPLHATLLPRVTITTRISDPQAVRMEVEDARPQAVTLMPTLRVLARQGRTNVPVFACLDLGSRATSAEPLVPAADGATLAAC